MIKTITLLVLVGLSLSSSIHAQEEADLDFSSLVEAEPKNKEVSPLNISTEPATNDQCIYEDDVRLTNLANILKDIDNDIKIEPLKIKINTYLEFSTTFIKKIGRKNIYIITEDCAEYPTELDDLPFKLELDFNELFNRLMSAVRENDDIKAMFISRNVVSAPINISGVISLLAKSEIEDENIKRITKYLPVVAVKDTVNKDKIKKGDYKNYLILLDVFKATGGKVLGDNLQLGLAEYGSGRICPGMNSSVFYVQGAESPGWLPGYYEKEEPYYRATTLLKTYGIKINSLSCKEYLKNTDRI